MAKVRVRPETGTLYLDFFYRNVRCREQTALSDTIENRKKVQSLLNQVEKAIAQGTFDYATTFPSSPRAEKFSKKSSESHEAPNNVLAAAMQAKPIAQTPAFSDFAELWFIEMSPQWRRQHRRGVRDMMNKYLLPTFGARCVGDIAKADVLAFRSVVSGMPGRKGTLTACSINKIMCFLRQILNEAADRFSFTPAFRNIKPLKQKKTDVQPFSLAEVQQILESVRADYRNYITARFFTGLRSGEINGLKWKHIDFDKNIIMVRETVSNGVEEEGVKTDLSIRDITMLPMVRTAIEEQFKRRDPKIPWVFSSPGGGPIDAHNFCNRVWYPLLRYLGLEKRRPYQTRHTAATLMLASGENPEWIAKMMGHANTQMLFTVYSRFVPNLTRQDGQAFAGLINSKIAPAAAALDTKMLARLQSMSPEQIARLMKLSTEEIANEKRSHL